MKEKVPKNDFVYVSRTGRKPRFSRIARFVKASKALSPQSEAARAIFLSKDWIKFIFYV